LEKYIKFGRGIIYGKHWRLYSSLAFPQLHLGLKETHK